MSRIVSPLIAFFAVASVGNAQQIIIVSPANLFDITCAGQNDSFVATNCNPSAPHMIVYEYKVPGTTTWSTIGGNFVTSNASGVINTSVSVGTLAPGAKDGRVTIKEYISPGPPTVYGTAYSTLGTFRGP